MVEDGSARFRKDNTIAADDALCRRSFHAPISCRRAYGSSRIDLCPLACTYKSDLNRKVPNVLIPFHTKQ